VSIRRRLMLVLSIGFGALILGTALYVEGFLRARVTEEFDVALLAEARGLAQLTELQEDGKVEFDYAPEHMVQFERKERPDYAQIFLGDGTPLPNARSGSLPEGYDLPFAAAGSGDLRLPDGRLGRVVRFSFVPSPDDGPASAGPTLVAVVARGRERLDDLVAGMRLAIFGAGAAAILIAALLVWRALDSGLRPISAIATQVQGLHAENLGARITVPSVPRELVPIVDQLNAMLVRLEASFDRERRFAGHVAHELRTPIAELRSLAEVGGKWPEDLASTRRFFADVHEIAARMERVVVDLLLLARCHAGVEKVERCPVRLAPLILSHPGVDRVEVEVPEDLIVESDPGKLSLIVSNLLDNALAYALPTGPIRCVAEARDSRFHLEIANPADPLTEDDVRNLAEPFWRKDRARSAEGHSGLGLSLVTALARLLGLEVGFRHESGLFRVRLSGKLWDGDAKPKRIQRSGAYSRPEPE